jgi:exodeoxyribonuclease VII large subunit
MPSLFDLPFEEPPHSDEDAPPGAHPTGAADRRVERPEPAVPRSPLTVTELTADIRSVLESGFAEVLVEGELSNCKLWQTGHLYFSLKDSGAQIRGVMFRSAVRLLKFKPEDGQHVIVRGRLSIYEAKGEYQIIGDTLEPRGLGALQLAFEQLKRRLGAAGLFDEARKRPLPVLPRKIGVVTSLDGAAIRDILSVLGKRYPQAHVVIRPARVQGDGAAQDVARGLRAIAAVDGVDVVIVARGGGSIEDLWAFNEEIVARAIAASPVPVISAVGHETDVTIADFVADFRAPTPSAAAETVVARRDEFVARIDRQCERLEAALRRRLLTVRSRVHVLDSSRGLARVPAALALRGRHVGDLAQHIRRVLIERLRASGRRLAVAERSLERHDPRRRLANTRTRLTAGRARLDAALERRRTSEVARLGALAGRLDSLSPLAVLGRGYAVCWDATRTRVIRSSADVTPGDAVRVTLGEGEIECDVKDIKP